MDEKYTCSHPLLRKRQFYWSDHGADINPIEKPIKDNASIDSKYDKGSQSMTHNQNLKVDDHNYIEEQN